MQVQFKYIEEFKKCAKVLRKRYKSFDEDYDKLLNALEKDPMQGVSLGGGVRKIRMAVASKRQGKSGGVRVLTYNAKLINPELVIITFLSVYDKSDIDNVKDAYIKGLLAELQ